MKNNILNSGYNPSISTFQTSGNEQEYWETSSDPKTLISQMKSNVIVVSNNVYTGFETKKINNTIFPQKK